MSSPSRNSQIENLTSWFAASVIVVAGVIYGLRPQPEPRAAEPQPLLPRATPAQEPLTIQQRRALEKGRGRRAHAPLQIPGRGWRDILVRTYYEIQEDRLLALAAGVSFYSLLSLFPGLAAGVSVYALFADPVMISRHLSVAAGVVPAETLDLLTTEISRIAAKSDGKLTFGFLLGLAIALWSANAGMKAIFDALNIIYDEQEKRGLIRLNVVSLFCTRMRPCRNRSCVCAGGDIPADSQRAGSEQRRCADDRVPALAADVCFDPHRLGGTLPLWTEPPHCKVALDQCRQRVCRIGLACRVIAVFMVSGQFRQL